MIHYNPEKNLLYYRGYEYSCRVEESLLRIPASLCDEKSEHASFSIFFYLGDKIYFSVHVCKKHFLELKPHKLLAYTSEGELRGIDLLFQFQLNEDLCPFCKKKAGAHLFPYRLCRKPMLWEFVEHKKVLEEIISTNKK